MFGNGTTLTIGTTQTASSLLSVSFGGYDADDLDTTTHDSTDHFRTFIKGLTDAGEIGVEALGDSDVVSEYAAMAATRTIYSATVNFPTTPSSSKFECNAYVKGFNIEGPSDDLIAVSFTLKIANKPTFSLV
jgi:hypothetical protein